MGVLKELKELVKEMGGDASQAQTIGQAIDKIPAAGGGGLGIHVVFDETTGSTRLDKTTEEIINAVNSGAYVALQRIINVADEYTYTLMPLTNLETEHDAELGDSYYFQFRSLDNQMGAYISSGLNEYPIELNS